MAITLQESLRGLFYAPFYVALAHDAYAAEGVEVRFVSSPRPSDAARNVLAFRYTSSHGVHASGRVVFADAD